jgi:adenosylcobinamide kinase/adenosylcobinamide-phosphate guanylyltransferase
MDSDLTVARSELVLGGQRSGKSRRAEGLARTWLSASTSHRAILIATGQASDDEMAERIAHHRQERAIRVPGMSTVEEPLHVAAKITELGAPETLLVIDCLTLWLVNWLMPMDATKKSSSSSAFADRAGELANAIANARGPVIFVSNEIGLGVIPLGPEVRAYVDTLGMLNQRVAAACERVTLMAAGLPLTLKGCA